MIRSESTKFGDYLKPKMPKSTSLPVIQVIIFIVYFIQKLIQLVLLLKY